jgi:hypothetical protein
VVFTVRCANGDLVIEGTPCLFVGRRYMFSLKKYTWDKLDIRMRNPEIMTTHRRAKIPKSH